MIISVTLSTVLLSSKQSVAFPCVFINTQDNHRPENGRRDMMFFWGPSNYTGRKQVGPFRKLLWGEGCICLLSPGVWVLLWWVECGEPEGYFLSDLNWVCWDSNMCGQPWGCGVPKVYLHEKLRILPGERGSGRHFWHSKNKNLNYNTADVLLNIAQILYSDLIFSSLPLPECLKSYLGREGTRIPTFPCNRLLDEKKREEMLQYRLGNFFFSQVKSFKNTYPI